jgi:metal-responsive CopG/Arc/MetJ family transcriptional regulator
MTAKAVQVSMDRELLGRIDADPEARERGRSAFIRSALLLYLEAKRRRGTDAAIRRAYGGKADELEFEIEGLMEAQSWPER